MAASTRRRRCDTNQGGDSFFLHRSLLVTHAQLPNPRPARGSGSSRREGSRIPTPKPRGVSRHRVRFSVAVAQPDIVAKLFEDCFDALRTHTTVLLGHGTEIVFAPLQVAGLCNDRVAMR